MGEFKIGLGEKIERSIELPLLILSPFIVIAVAIGEVVFQG